MMMRMAEWGNWGILFYEKNDVGDYAPSKIHGRLNFPVGARGPMDGFVGSPERKQYQAAVTAWMDRGVLPSNLESVGA